jgi:hypothetical protein
MSLLDPPIGRIAGGQVCFSMYINRSSVRNLQVSSERIRFPCNLSEPEDVLSVEETALNSIKVGEPSIVRIRVSILFLLKLPPLTEF